MKKKLKTFKTLKKISSSRLDEIRSLVGEIDKKQGALQIEEKMLEKSEEKERTVLSQDPLSGLTYAAFLQRIQKRRDAIYQNYHFLEKEKEKLLQDLQVHFQNQKKWEIMISNTQEYLKKEEKKEEQKVLDQLSEQRHYWGQSKIL